MPRVAFTSLLTLFCFAAAAQDGGELRGTVIDAVTLEPIAGATIYARARNCAYSSTTSAKGTFFVWGMMPGTFHITLDAPGMIFIRAEGNDPLPEPVITLKEDQKADNLRFEMIAFGTISGHVRNESGKPLRARIDAFPIPGRTMGWQIAASATTNANGTYSLHVAPGQYVLKASLTADPGHREFYWLASPQKNGATPVEAQSGHERANLDFEFGKSTGMLNRHILGIPDGTHPVEDRLAAWDFLLAAAVADVRRRSVP